MDVAILGVEREGRQYAGASARAESAVSLCGADANAVLDAVEGVDTGTDARIDGTTDVPAAVEDADVVVETRSFDPETARERLAEIEDHASEGALLAVTLETASLTTLTVALREPERLVGLHSGAPTGIGDPIEVVLAELTSQATAREAVAFVEGLGWSALRVRDTPGFVSERLRLATQAEAIRLYEQGIANPAAVDEVMVVADGHSVGPLELADRQGLDSVASALDTLAAELGSRYEPPQLLTEKVTAGQLGRASGEGFYTWEDGQPVDPTDE